MTKEAPDLKIELVENAKLKEQGSFSDGEAKKSSAKKVAADLKDLISKEERKNEEMEEEDDEDEVMSQDQHNEQEDESRKEEEKIPNAK